VWLPNKRSFVANKRFFVAYLAAIQVLLPKKQFFDFASTSLKVFMTKTKMMNDHIKNR